MRYHIKLEQDFEIEAENYDEAYLAVVEKVAGDPEILNLQNMSLEIEEEGDETR